MTAVVSFDRDEVAPLEIGSPGSTPEHQPRRDANRGSAMELGASDHLGFGERHLPGGRLAARVQPLPGSRGCADPAVAVGDRRTDECRRSGDRGSGRPDRSAPGPVVDHQPRASAAGPKPPLGGTRRLADGDGVRGRRDLGGDAARSRGSRRRRAVLGRDGAADRMGGHGGRHGLEVAVGSRRGASAPADPRPVDRRALRVALPGAAGDGSVAVHPRIDRCRRQPARHRSDPADCCAQPRLHRAGLSERPVRGSHRLGRVHAGAPTAGAPLSLGTTQRPAHGRAAGPLDHPVDVCLGTGRQRVPGVGGRQAAGRAGALRESGRRPADLRVLVSVPGGSAGAELDRPGSSVSRTHGVPWATTRSAAPS